MVPDTKLRYCSVGCCCQFFCFVCNSFAIGGHATGCLSSSTAAMDFEKKCLQNRRKRKDVSKIGGKEKMSPKLAEKEKMSPQSAEKKEDFHTKDSLIRVLERQVYASWDSHAAVFMPVFLHLASGVLILMSLAERL